MVTFTTILLVLAVIALASSIHISKENERFATYILGRFVGLKGPGLSIIAPGSMKAVRVALRAEGRVQSSELVTVGDAAIPFKSSKPLAPGTAVRVSAFEPGALRVEAIQNYVVCEKCGHKNAV